MTAFSRVKSFLDILSTLAVTAAAGFLIWALVDNRSRPPAQRNAAAVERLDARMEASKITNVKGKAPLAIVEFADYECPFCGTHARDMWPAIKKELIDTGKAEYVYLHFPLEPIHPFALKASEAAECAAKQGHYWEMHEQLFKDAKALAPGDLVRHAETVGLDGTAFERCLAGEALAKIRADQAEGKRLGVQGTPTFFLGTVQADGSLKLLKKFAGATDVSRFKTEFADLSAPQARAQ